MSANPPFGWIEENSGYIQDGRIFPDWQVHPETESCLSGSSGIRDYLQSNVARCLPLTGSLRHGGCL